ncbi:MAG: hypothetical protein R3C99_15515, partial [Pirellulaceae bacterium]
MSTFRVSDVPFDHVIAELAAFPLAAEESFAAGIEQLDPAVERAEPMRRLWRAAERRMTEGQAAMSLDELVALRDRLWFWDEGSRITLEKYLRHLADEFLAANASIARPTLRAERDFEGRGRPLHDPRWRQAWRWLSFALPADMLLAALHDGRQKPSRVELLSPQVAQLLMTHGFAETHLHIGAALDFPTLWVALQHALADTNMKADSFRGPGAVFGEGRDFAPWLVRAALVRWMLAMYLGSRDSRPFAEFLCDLVEPNVRQWCGAASHVYLRMIVREMLAGRFADESPAFYELRDLYARATQITTVPLPDQLDDVAASDPIASLIDASVTRTMTAEMRLIASALERLPTADPVFRGLFWQTQRLRVMFYRHVVQRPLTPGLQWFIRTYGRLKSGRRRVSSRLLVESAATLGGFGEGLRSLEVRTSPDADASDLLELIADFDTSFFAFAGRQSQRRASAVPTNDLSNSATWNRPAEAAVRPCVDPCIEPPEFGVVLHFTKARGGGAEKGVPRAHWANSHADPSPRDASDTGSSRDANASGFRYAAFYADKRREAQALVALLTRFPLSLRVVRGLDVCTDELAAPTWVFAPLFRYVREAANAASLHLSELGIEAPPLRTSVHAGEDFVHLLGGLRRVDEAVRYLGLCEGDRIGHGVALGIDATRWCRAAGRLPVMREERLLDLSWEWTCYSRFEVAADVDRLAWIEREVPRLSDVMFGERLTPYDVECLVSQLHREHTLRRLGFPAGNSFSSTDDAADDADDWKRAERRARAYLTSPRLFRAGRAIEWVDPFSEAPAIERLQSYLRQRIASLGLCVEVNPTSNLLIGNLGDLTRHPLWRLRPPRPTPDLPPVSICIGSDDPITFATNLRHEYMLLHDAMILADLTYDEAKSWLNDVRQSGLESRFTIPRPYQNIRDHIAIGLDTSI